MFMIIIFYIKKNYKLNIIHKLRKTFLPKIHNDQRWYYDELPVIIYLF